MLKLALLLFCFFISQNSAYAFINDTYVFQDEVTEKRYKSLVKELRCPKCQNQNLADSNSPIAADLRQEVYELLNQGKADSEIVAFMVKRYGDFVLYRPKVDNATYLLWFGPALLLLLSVIGVILVIRQKQKQQPKQALSAEQKEKLAQILKDK